MFNESVFLGLIVVICAFQSITCPIGGAIVLPKRKPGQSVQAYADELKAVMAPHGITTMQFSFSKNGRDEMSGTITKDGFEETPLPGYMKFSKNAVSQWPPRGSISKPFKEARPSFNRDVIPRRTPEFSPGYSPNQQQKTSYPASKPVTQEPAPANRYYQMTRGYNPPIPRSTSSYNQQQPKPIIPLPISTISKPVSIGERIANNPLSTVPQYQDSARIGGPFSGAQNMFNRKDTIQTGDSSVKPASLIRSGQWFSGNQDIISQKPVSTPERIAYKPITTKSRYQGSEKMGAPFSGAQNMPVSPDRNGFGNAPESLFLRNGGTKWDAKQQDTSRFPFTSGLQQSPTRVTSPNIDNIDSQPAGQGRTQFGYNPVKSVPGSRLGQLIGENQGVNKPSGGFHQSWMSSPQNTPSPASVPNQFPKNGRQGSIPFNGAPVNSESVLGLGQLFKGYQDEDKPSLPNTSPKAGANEARTLARKLATHFKTDIAVKNGQMVTNADLLGLCEKGVDKEMLTLKAMKRADESLIYVISRWTTDFRNAFYEINQQLSTLEPIVTKAYIECVRFKLVLTTI